MPLRPAAALLSILTACGGLHAGDPPDAGSESPDAGPVCQIARPQRHTPGQIPPPVYTTAGRAHRAGPIALPHPTSGPLHPVVTDPTGRAARTLRRATPPGRVGMRLLLLTAFDDTPSYLAARAAFERIGVPFDVAVVSDDYVNIELLYTPEGDCRYQGIILSTDSLGYENPQTGEWASALTDTEWETLDMYEVECAAREVAWYAYPGEDNGLEAGDSFNADDDVTARLADGAAARFPYLVADLTVPIQYVWGYRGTIVDPAVTTPLFETTDGDVLAVIHERADGTEVLAMTLDAGTFSVHSQLLEYGIVDWVTGGVFLGKRRAYLAPQIDDIFLHTDLYPEESGNEYRMTGDDADAIADWQADLNARLPAGSSFVTHLGFNGAGSLPSIYPDTSLMNALRAREAEFEWINHTWSHPSLDDMSAADTEDEMRANCDLAELWDLTRFTCTSAVTPHISGLNNPNAVQGMLASGVRFVVSDTSYTEAIAPENPGNNPSPNTGRENPSNPELFQVPRHPTNIFFSTSVPDEQVALFNELYRDWFGRDLSYEEMIQADSDFGLSYLLSYDIDPLMFHQGNLRWFTGADGLEHTLYSDWIERVLERYLAMVDLPILSPSLREIGDEMKRRAAYDACGIEAVIDTAPDGQRAIVLTAAAECEAPITGVNAPEAGEVEVYAGVPTTTVTLAPCQETSFAIPEAP